MLLTVSIELSPARAHELAAVEAHLRAARLPTVGLAAALERTLVARDGATIAGTAALERRGADALLRSVAVADRARGHGLGEQLVRAALSAARVEGVRTVYLLTETAADWFPRFGFRPVRRMDLPPALAVLPEVTEACAETAVAMRVDLDEVHDP